MKRRKERRNALRKGEGKWETRTEGERMREGKESRGN